MAADPKPPARRRQLIVGLVVGALVGLVVGLAAGALMRPPSE